MRVYRYKMADGYGQRWHYVVANDAAQASAVGDAKAARRRTYVSTVECVADAVYVCK